MSLHIVESQTPMQACEYLLADPHSDYMRELCFDALNDGTLPLSFLEEHAPETLKIFYREYNKHKGEIPFEPGYVYFIKAKDSNFCKIGKSIKPDKRLAQISPKMPYECELLSTRRSFFMGMAERDYHKHFDYCRVNEEWFEGLSLEDFLEIPDEVVMLPYVWHLANEVKSIFDGAYLQHICEYSFDPFYTSTFLALDRVAMVFKQIQRKYNNFGGIN